MKVLHIIASVDPRGGGPIEGIFSSSLVWSKHGHERNIVSLDPPNSPWLRTSPIRTFSVGLSASGNPTLRRLVPWLRYGYTPHLVKWLNVHAREYDAAIINGLWNYSSYGTWRVLRRLKVPYFVFTHGMLDPWFNTRYPLKFIFKNMFWKLFERNVLRDARGVFFTCEEERLLAATSFAPYVAREFVVGYGTRDISGDPRAQRAAFFAKAPNARDRKFILFLGRIHEKKGIDLLIEGFARHANEFPDFDLVIAGPNQSNLRASLTKLATERGIGARIQWPGMLSGDAKWGAFRAAEFFVLPSHQENFGVVVAEAMALAKPVLITNKVNIWREIEADGAGRVVNDDVDAIAGGLRAMCSLSASESEEIGRKARKCFCDRYNLDENAMNLLALMAKMLPNREEPAAADVSSLQ